MLHHVEIYVSDLKPHGHSTTFSWPNWATRSIRSGIKGLSYKKAEQYTWSLSKHHRISWNQAITVAVPRHQSSGFSCGNTWWCWPMAERYDQTSQTLRRPLSPYGRIRSLCPLFGRPRWDQDRVGGEGNMNLVIIGAQASGKMTIGQEVERLTDLVLFHNHESIDFVTKFFSNVWRSERTLYKWYSYEVFETSAKTDLEFDFYSCYWL